MRGMKERLIVGLAWEGTIAEAEKGDIHRVIEDVKNRSEEIDGKINESELVCVSIHDRPNGFTHHVGWEVETGIKVPTGMVSCVLPEGTYFTLMHQKEENIAKTYTNLKQEIQNKGLTPLKPEQVDSFDELPIKIELHSVEKILKEEPEFQIHIPVIK
ncbi:GyrI-like domain-containing protein [Salipaludibacillus sp. HK11]|uniref:GyrI-like domain-containing protein n=1 Tax=Salipaludibacillus sp. HK11 TaxID=3394320 RepID=UPI0039FD1C79